MIRQLVGLANRLDEKGLTVEADFVDNLIKRSYDAEGSSEEEHNSRAIEEFGKDIVEYFDSEEGEVKRSLLSDLAIRLTDHGEDSAILAFSKDNADAAKEFSEKLRNKDIIPSLEETLATIISNVAENTPSNIITGYRDFAYDPYGTAYVTLEKLYSKINEEIKYEEDDLDKFSSADERSDSGTYTNNAIKKKMLRR